MNTDEREWQAQELAAKAERAGNVLLDLDPLSAGYVPIVRALREPMAVDVGVPAIHVVALQVWARPVGVSAPDGQHAVAGSAVDDGDGVAAVPHSWRAAASSTGV